MITLISEFINLFFPKVCLSCNSRLQKKEHILCSICKKKIDFFTDCCLICGSEKDNNTCHTCETSEFYFDRARSVFRFNKTIQNLIHNLKYNEITSLAKFLGDYCVKYLTEYRPFEKIDIITPVPLHKVKKKSRGFNQAEIVAREIARQTEFKHIPNLIKRKKFTNTQTKLSKFERIENVSNAFKINHKYPLENKNILLIDDVFTTGSTVNAVSKLLKNNKVNKIYVLTIARA